MRAVAVHGGPGAPGTVSSLCRGLSSLLGTIEPFQRAMTVDGQVEELDAQIIEHADPPVYLFGHSWGAWLVYLLAFRHPDIVLKAFLIGSGPFDVSYVPQLKERRKGRLGRDDRTEYDRLPGAIAAASGEERNALLGRLGELAGKADSVCVRDVPENAEDAMGLNAEQYQAIWSEAASLRANGYFVSIASRVRVPLRIIQGDSDPCPIAGVIDPIRQAVPDLKWYEVERAGHEPWKEEYGRGQFWRIVMEEIKT